MVWRSRSSPTSRKGGLACKPVLGEITYGLERLAMYLAGQGERVRPGLDARRDLSRRLSPERVEQSKYNFELSNTDMLFRHFGEYEAEAKRLIDAQCVLPGYEMVMKASHTFNLLDARRDLGHRARGVHRPRARPRARSGPGVLRVSRAPRLSHEALMQALLVEMLTEELPPKSLRQLSEVSPAAC